MGRATISQMNAARAAKPASGGKLYQRTVATAPLAPGSFGTWEQLFAQMIQGEHEATETFLRAAGLMGHNRYMSRDDILFSEGGF